MLDSMAAKPGKTPRRGRRVPQTVGSVIGTIAGVVLIVGGLATAGTIVLVVVAINQLGSNK